MVSSKALRYLREKYFRKPNKGHKHNSGCVPQTVMPGNKRCKCHFNVCSVLLQKSPPPQVCINKTLNCVFAILLKVSLTFQDTSKVNISDKYIRFQIMVKSTITMTYMKKPHFSYIFIKSCIGNKSAGCRTPNDQTAYMM